MAVQELGRKACNNTVEDIERHNRGPTSKHKKNGQRFNFPTILFLRFLT